MKSKNTIYWAIGVIVIVLIAAISILSTPKVEESYKIGVLSPLTGPVSHLGTPYVKGMELAVEEININGGINGKQLKILAQDSKLDGAESVNAVRHLLNTEDPDVFSVLLAIPAYAVDPILKEAKKPFIYEAYSISIAENNPYAFKANYNPLIGCEKLAKYIASNKDFSNWGIIMPQGEFSTLCFEGLGKVNSNINEYWYDIGETDFRTLLSKANDAGVDLLYTLCLGQECVNIPKQLSELNYPIQLAAAGTASESIFPAVVESASPEVLNGILSVDFVPIHEIGESEFAKKYTAKYPNPAPIDISYGALGYEEIMIYSKAFQECEKGDSECIVLAIENVADYKSVLGSHGFENGVLQFDLNLYEFGEPWWQLIVE